MPVTGETKITRDNVLLCSAARKVQKHAILLSPYVFGQPLKRSHFSTKSILTSSVSASEQSIPFRAESIYVELQRSPSPPPSSS